MTCSSILRIGNNHVNLIVLAQITDNFFKNSSAGAADNIAYQ